MSRARLAAVLVLAGALLLAVLGGEYGLLDWRELRGEVAREREQIARLTVEVDSLKRYLERVGSDRRLVEQLARENFGMVRPGEVLYRLAPDSLDER